jgi:hypothetical protein
MIWVLEGHDFCSMNGFRPRHPFIRINFYWMTRRFCLSSSWHQNRSRVAPLRKIYMLSAEQNYLSQHYSFVEFDIDTEREQRLMQWDGCHKSRDFHFWTTVQATMQLGDVRKPVTTARLTCHSKIRAGTHYSYNLCLEYGKDGYKGALQAAK